MNFTEAGICASYAHAFTLFQYTWSKLQVIQGIESAQIPFDVMYRKRHSSSRFLTSYFWFWLFDDRVSAAGRENRKTPALSDGKRLLRRHPQQVCNVTNNLSVVWVKTFASTVLPDSWFHPVSILLAEKCATDFGQRRRFMVCLQVYLVLQRRPPSKNFTGVL